MLAPTFFRAAANSTIRERLDSAYTFQNLYKILRQKKDGSLSSSELTEDVCTYVLQTARHCLKFVNSQRT